MCGVKRVAALACAAAVLVTSAVLATAGTGRPPLLALVLNKTLRLVRLDPLTLRQVGSRSLRLSSLSGAWSRSPDGSMVAFGSAGQGVAVYGSARRGASVRLVDVRGIRAAGVLQLGLQLGRAGANVDVLVWASARTLLAVTNDGSLVVGVDPVSRHVRWRKLIPAGYEAVARSAAGLVLLAPPDDGTFGPTKLVTVDQNGRVRSVVLSGIRSGQPQDYSGTSLSTGAQPGLAIDPQGNKAYVVAGGAPVADVDLATLTVSYHTLSRSLAVIEKGLNGPIRTATWLGNGLIAVTGSDDRSWIDAQGKSQEVDTPAGLTILDTRTWTTRVVDSAVSAATVAGGLLFAYGTSWDTTSNPGAPTGIGLSGYTLDGSARFHLFGQTAVGPVQAANGLAYAWSYGATAAISIIDLASEQPLRTVPARNLELLIEPNP